MGKAKNKSELISESQKQFEKLYQMIDGMDEELRSGSFRFDVTGKKERHWSRDKNVRDVLAHLYEWQKLQLTFVKENTAGRHAAFLPAPYTWKSYGAMNDVFWEKHQQSTCADLYQKLSHTHQELLLLIETFSDEALYTKKYFDWTGTTSLGQYFQSSLPSHYDWALKKLRLHQKTF